jgi:hypothetical protein
MKPIHAEHVVTLPFSPRAIARAVIVAVGIIHGIMLLFIVLRYLGHDRIFGVARKFDPRLEVSVPTWLATVTLAACATVLAIYSSAFSRARDRFSLHWLGLALGFAYLSIDEAAEIHERLLGYLATVTFGGRIPQMWAIFGVAIVALIGLTYIRFLSHLPPAARNMFLVAAAIFLIGGAGVELAGGLYRSAGNGEDVIYLSLAFLEETLEATGSGLFLYALFAHAPVITRGALTTPGHVQMKAA